MNILNKSVKDLLVVKICKGETLKCLTFQEFSEQINKI
jgi:hypothetical protein